MFDRALGFFRGSSSRNSSRGRAACRPQFEGLEDRKLLVASIAPIADITVPQSLGYQVAIDGSASNATTQSFTVTSSNPDIKATIAQGPFVTFTVSHTPASGHPTDPTITNQTMTFQFFNDLTPNTASRISNLAGPNPQASWTAAGYPTNWYNTTGKYIDRIVGNFDGQPNGFVIQGGYTDSNGGSTGSGVPTIGIEPVQQLAYVQPYSIAMARSTSTTSNDAQFFVTTGTPTSLNYQYTLFGQMVSGQATADQLTKVAVQSSTAIPGETSQPISPVVINSAVSTPNSPDGVIHIDATGAITGETSTITVTATDPVTNTTATKTFNVTVGANDPSTHPASFTFKPLAFPVTQSVPGSVSTTVQLDGTTQNPNNKAVTLEYALASQPSHGTITNLNTTTGTLTYTPNAGYIGPDSFTYSVTNIGGSPTPLAGNTQTVTLNVTSAYTGAVRLVGTTLIVTPLPRWDGGTNTITVGQQVVPNSPANEHILVQVNGLTDITQPLASSVNHIVVYGSKASDNIQIAPTLDPTILVTVDGGQGGKNTIQAGPGSTRVHAWYGKNTLMGGTGANQLIGRAGHVVFKPTATSQVIYAGVLATPKHKVVSGQYYKYVNGKLVKTSPPAVYALQHPLKK